MPKWLDRFCERVTTAIQTNDESALVGCHTHHNRESPRTEWEVTVFISGDSEFSEANDGEIAAPRFMLDLREVVLAFDAVVSFYWQSERLADDDQIGPHVGVTGEFERQHIWLRVAGKPPEEFSSDGDVYAETTDDRW